MWNSNTAQYSHYISSLFRHSDHNHCLLTDEEVNELNSIILNLGLGSAFFPVESTNTFLFQY